MYGNFAGRDASRGMAKQSFDTGTPLVTLLLRNSHCGLEMLTPVDQPLDKLTDLQQDEMSVSLSFLLHNYFSNLSFTPQR
jgi:membrane-associated progesterone receptor component